jgi:FkbM family methyltransferase
MNRVDLGIRRPADLARRLVRTAGGIRDELAWGFRACADLRSLVRYLSDVLLYRVLAFVDIGGGRRVREIRLRDGTRLTYRLNRGDIRLIPEVFGLEIYRLPRSFDRLTVVDLGANIGLVSLFLASRYELTHVLAVEPSPGNAAVLRTNLERNGIPGEVVEAAAGPEDGVGLFADNERVPTLGMMGQEGRPVSVISMPTLLERLPKDATVDVLKLDIEGAEAELFAADDLSWLERVRLIMIELHPKYVPVEPVVDRLRERGFEYVPLDVHPSAWLCQDAMAVFVRSSEGLSPSEIPGAVSA